MERLKRYQTKPHVVNCSSRPDEIKTRQGLAYTPSDMNRLNERGMPVNCANIESMYFDGVKNPSFHITSDKVRDADVAELWEEREVLKDKARVAVKSKNTSS